MNQFIAKVFYENSIHRFAVDDPSFDSLEQSVKHVLHLPATAAIVFRYRDEDDDLVTFDSDAELIEALNVAAGNANNTTVLRLFIESKKEQEEQEKEQEEEEEEKEKAPEEEYSGRGRFGGRFRGARHQGGRGRGRRFGCFGNKSKFAFNAEPTGSFGRWKAKQFQPVVQTKEEDKAMWEGIPLHIRRRILHRHNISFDDDADFALFQALPEDAQARVRFRSACHARRRQQKEEQKDDEEEVKPMTDEEIWHKMPDHVRRRILTRNGAVLTTDTDVSNVAFFHALPVHVQHRIRHRWSNNSRHRWNNNNNSNHGGRCGGFFRGGRRAHPFFARFAKNTPWAHQQQHHQQENVVVVEEQDH